MKCDMSHIPTIGLIGILRHRCEQRAKEMFGKYDLNKTHANILFSLHQSQSLSQKELAERLNVTPPSITSAIQKGSADYASGTGAKRQRLHRECQEGSTAAGRNDVSGNEYGGKITDEENAAPGM